VTLLTTIEQLMVEDMARRLMVGPGFVYWNHTPHTTTFVVPPAHTTPGAGLAFHPTVSGGGRRR
jgi:hypothetical protein